ncbi:LOW QUALITY PROTEIN: interleukin-18 receptor 1 [Gracilinanus agilis]|uniref:LOW QUALITY PROTEIN: interleukin-18 receptor 1 n=1 Tax=Gracilinanus agilis TaxID=191870 RepID=UPI001CFCF521|nr:LOW QUALITY PROTEIN: interleukin-18 receptor 1 [Gracilinanus agilis]
MGRNEHMKRNIFLIKKNKHSCFHPNNSMTIEGQVGKFLKINCIDDYYQKKAYHISLLKNCSPIPGNSKPYIWKNAELNDEGNYTCIFFLLNNARLFNVTKTFSVKINDNRNTIPTLFGKRINYVEAELGKEKTLNCTAALKDPTDILYWNFFNNSDNNINIRTLHYRDWNAKGLVSKFLEIKTVKKENLNIWYNCTLASAEILETVGYFLKKKEGPADISRNIFIIALVSSALVIFLVIMCVIYRVDILLCYRDLLRRDETLLDGKEYDAFVSYLKDSQSDNGEENKFALEILPEALEKRFGYKLCIFERDIIPGGAIVDDIHSLINKSRRLIIVLSENYISNKVKYELESGLHEALVERKIKIILIEFTPIRDFTFLPQSLKLLKSHRILKWKADKSLPYNSRFWKNLRYLMPAKNPQTVFSLDPLGNELLPVFSKFQPSK